LIKPPHKYPNLEFNKGYQEGSSGRLGKISLISQWQFTLWNIIFCLFKLLSGLVWSWFCWCCGDDRKVFSLFVWTGMFGIWKVATGIL